MRVSYSGRISRLFQHTLGDSSIAQTLCAKISAFSKNCFLSPNWQFFRSSRTESRIRKNVLVEQIMQNTLKITLSLIFFCLCSICRADLVISGLGANGQGGQVHGHSISFGNSGAVYELDSFLAINGFDLNGATIGTAAQLSLHALPNGLSMTPSYSLSANGKSLEVNYQFRNNTGLLLSNIQFLSFLDAEIDVPNNTYFNEFATTSGTLGTGVADSSPDAFEIDEPGYVFGDIFDNLRLGQLDNTNAITSAFPDDVSMALGFRLGNIQDGGVFGVKILLSEESIGAGNFAIVHRDADSGNTDQLTFSGTVISGVPEPSSLLLATCAALATVYRRVRHHLKSSKAVTA